MSENKKFEKLENARSLAKTISMFALWVIILWSIVFALLGTFSYESPFTSGEKLGYALAVLVPSGIAVLLAWFRYLNIRNVLSDSYEQKD